MSNVEVVMFSGAPPDMSDSESEDVNDEVTGKQDVLVYVDDNHQGATLARLNTLRKGGHLCDVVIEVDGHSIPAHRAVLACASNYLFQVRCLSFMF